MEFVGEFCWYGMDFLGDGLVLFLLCGKDAGKLIKGRGQTSGLGSGRVRGICGICGRAGRIYSGMVSGRNNRKITG